MLIFFPDGDLITIFDSSDLSFAIQCSRILKLQILPNSDNKGDNSAVSLATATALKKQLRTIRDQVIGLLDSLEINETGPPTSSEGKLYNSFSRAFLVTVHMILLQVPFSEGFSHILGVKQNNDD